VTFGARNEGSDSIPRFATVAFEAFADMNFELKSRFVGADGKAGALEWVWRGRQIKDFPGLPATNKPFEVRGATVERAHALGQRFAGKEIYCRVIVADAAHRLRAG
jgi:hypothetical protein